MRYSKSKQVNTNAVFAQGIANHFTANRLMNIRPISGSFGSPFHSFAYWRVGSNMVIYEWSWGELRPMRWHHFLRTYNKSITPV
jgi:hypothetical protein